MDTLDILHRFLTAYAHTAATREFEKHMDLYTQDVELYGVPGHSVLYYDGIAMRRNNELNNGLLLRVSFSAPEILCSDKDVIAYRVRETLKSTYGSALALDEEVTLRRDPDGKWRIHRARITRAKFIQLDDNDPLL